LYKVRERREWGKVERRKERSALDSYNRIIKVEDKGGLGEAGGNWRDNNWWDSVQGIYQICEEITCGMGEQGFNDNFNTSDLRN
jgi:hypothetical protein